MFPAPKSVWMRRRKVGPDFSRIETGHRKITKPFCDEKKEGKILVVDK